MERVYAYICRRVHLRSLLSTRASWSPRVALTYVNTTPSLMSGEGDREGGAGEGKGTGEGKEWEKRSEREIP